MKRKLTVALFLILIALLSVIPVHAQDEDVVKYYVDRDYNPLGNLCEDGTMQCPFNRVDEALDKGYKELCEGQQFYVYVKTRDGYPDPDDPTIVEWGKKPVPGMGLPLARVAQIVILALAGLVLLALALRLQRRKAIQ